MGSSSYYNIEISDNEFKRLAELIYKKSGIRLAEHKKEMVKARLAKRVRYHHFRSFKEYYGYIAEDESGEELVEMLNAIATNVTHFFREKVHFDLLVQKVLPKLIERKKKRGDSRIRVWSAGCSTGEEVYSILLTLNEFFKSEQGYWDIKVLGSDLSTKVLHEAKAGVYDEKKIEGLPAFYVERYFSVFKDKGKNFFQIKESIRHQAVFARINLISESFPFKRKFDIIFCRNVMIYFDQEVRNKLVANMYSFLDESGYLFVGHSETLLGTNAKFKSLAPALFEKNEAL